jgi:hypothetical protein
MSWRLNRTVQCAKCPWKVGVDPHTIPNGYSVEKHKALIGTIAEPGIMDSGRAMACHEMHDTHCVGWLVHQIGPGNNIGLRIRMTNCENARDIRTVGAQHERFEDTLPDPADNATITEVKAKQPHKKHAGGRPRGVEMPCGWCSKPLTAKEMRTHFTDCPKKPKA